MFQLKRIHAVYMYSQTCILKSLMVQVKTDIKWKIWKVAFELMFCWIKLTGKDGFLLNRGDLYDRFDCIWFNQLSFLISSAESCSVSLSTSSWILSFFCWALPSIDSACRMSLVSADFCWTNVLYGFLARGSIFCTNSILDGGLAHGCSLPLIVKYTHMKEFI